MTVITALLFVSLCWTILSRKVYRFRLFLSHVFISAAIITLLDGAHLQVFEGHAMPVFRYIGSAICAGGLTGLVFLEANYVILNFKEQRGSEKSPIKQSDGNHSEGLHSKDLWAQFINCGEDSIIVFCVIGISSAAAFFAVVHRIILSSIP